MRGSRRWWGRREIEIRHDNQCAARHERCYGRGHQILNLEHYLDVLEKKPGAMAGSTPLQQWRQAGRWPACLDRIWEQLEQRLGKSDGTREMITLVRVGSVSGWDRLIAAVEEALRMGVTDAAAVLHILRMPDPEERRRYAIALAEELAQFERPMPVMDEYDLLLTTRREASNEEPNGSLEHASVRQYCKAVRMPTIGANFLSLAEQAVKENHSHIRYLEALLAMECEERDRHAIANRIRDAQLPRMKTLEEFDFAQAPQIPAARIRELAEGGYIERSEPVVLIGECGTGKSHLATGLCLAACRQKRRVRFTTAAALVNELVEAKQNNQVRRLMSRWQRYELIALDEVGYVPLADIGAEFLFQVISERAERAALIVTTNLPFSEWTTVFPNPRLCKALLDRITDRAHIIETGTESFRFRRTVERRKKH